MSEWCPETRVLGGQGLQSDAVGNSVDLTLQIWCGTLLESDFNYRHSKTLNICSLGKGFELFGVQVWAVINCEKSSVYLAIKGIIPTWEHLLYYKQDVLRTHFIVSVCFWGCLPWGLFSKYLLCTCGVSALWRHWKCSREPKAAPPQSLYWDCFIFSPLNVGKASQKWFLLSFPGPTFLVKRILFLSLSVDTYQENINVRKRSQGKIHGMQTSCGHECVIHPHV